MTLLVYAIQEAIREIARAKHLTTARVEWKVNARSEMVIAMIIPPRTPGEWEGDPVGRREEKRAAREKRG